MGELPQNNQIAPPKGIGPGVAVAGNQVFLGSPSNPFPIQQAAPPAPQPVQQVSSQTPQALQPAPQAPLAAQPLSQGASVPQGAPSYPTTASDGTPLDPGVLKVMGAIRQIESGGDYNASGDNGKSLGAFQWNNGKQALAPGQLPANFVSAAKQFGLDPTDFSPANQNHVAYLQIQDFKNQGLTPIEVDAKWNGANYDSATNTYTHINPARAQTFTQALAEQNTGTAAPSAAQSAPLPTPEAPASVGGFLGNVVQSGANLLGNIGNAALHPIQTVQNIGSAAVGGLQELGGQQTNNTQNFDNVVNYFKDRYGGVSNLEHSLYTDPVGVAADLATVFSAGAGAAGALGKVGELSGIAGAADKAGVVANALSKAGELTNPIAYGAKGVAALITPAKRVATAASARLAGLSSETAGEIAKNPLVTPENIATMTRDTVSGQVAEAFATREASLADDISHYKPITESGAAVAVPHNWLENQIRNVAKADVVDGKIVPTTTTTIRASQLSGLQDIFNQFKPAFQDGSLTAEEFLNLRRQLDQVAYGTSGIKDSRVAGVASQIRGKLNTDFRSSIPGLNEVDASVASQLDEVKTLRKGLFDKNGNLLQNADSSIANAANATKSTRVGSTIDRLEQLVPGITQQLKALKAIENIRNARGIKAGAYDRSILEAGGAIGAAMTGHVAMLGISAAGMILGNPDMAVRIIRGLNEIDPGAARVALARLARYATSGAVSSSATQTGGQTTATGSQPLSLQPVDTTDQTPADANAQSLVLPTPQ